MAGARILLGFALGLAPAALSAATVYVHPLGPTIQAGIDSAAAGMPRRPSSEAM